jgi:putative glutathione S-transferase
MGPINDEGRKGWIFAHDENKPNPGPIAELLEKYPLTKDANGILQVAEGIDIPNDLLEHLRVLDPTNQLVNGVNTTDFVNNKRTLREVYHIDNPSFEGRFTVPMLFDTKTNSIVNTESAEIMQIFDVSFQDFAKKPDWSLVPSTTTTEEVSAACAKMNDAFIMAIYKAGYANSQEVYINAQTGIYNYLDYLNELLTKQRFICGEQFSEADVRATATLFRFDPIFSILFKLGKRVAEYPAISDYLADIWQNVLTDEGRDSYNETHLKYGYYCGQENLNKFAIVPKTTPTDFARQVQYRSALKKTE